MRYQRQHTAGQTCRSITKTPGKSAVSRSVSRLRLSDSCVFVGNLPSFVGCGHKTFTAEGHCPERPACCLCAELPGHKQELVDYRNLIAQSAVVLVKVQDQHGTPRTVLLDA